MRNEEHMEELCPDYIVLDEFHRCGAAEWGKSVSKLLEMYPKAKLLGLSATNIRYLDGQRDMAQEIFKGNIASEKSNRGQWKAGNIQLPQYMKSRKIESGRSKNGWKCAKNNFQCPWNIEKTAYREVKRL